MPTDLLRASTTRLDLARTCVWNPPSACSTSASPPIPCCALAAGAAFSAIWRRNGEINTITGNRQPRGPAPAPAPINSRLDPRSRASAHDARRAVRQRNRPDRLCSMDGYAGTAAGRRDGDIVRAMRLLLVPCWPPARPVRQNNPDIRWIRNCAFFFDLTPWPWSRGTAWRHHHVRCPTLRHAAAWRNLDRGNGLRPARPRHYQR